MDILKRRGIIERLAEGPVLSNGSMIATLKKRGYASAGPWTPEATVSYPDAVRALLMEYLRAGSDVLQTPCFYASDGKLEYSGVYPYQTTIGNSGFLLPDAQKAKPCTSVSEECKVML